MRGGLEPEMICGGRLFDEFTTRDEFGETVFFNFFVYDEHGRYRKREVHFKTQYASVSPFVPRDAYPLLSDDSNLRERKRIRLWAAAERR